MGNILAANMLTYSPVDGRIRLSGNLSLRDVSISNHYNSGGAKPAGTQARRANITSGGYEYAFDGKHNIYIWSSGSVSIVGNGWLERIPND